MPSHLTDSQLGRIYGMRLEGQAVFEPWELGFRCPRGHKGPFITWSEFNRHIWCYKCKLDYLSDVCPIQRPSWQSKEDFLKDVKGLPFRPRILRGIDRTMEDLDVLERGIRKCKRQA